jgi:phenylpyruvate tautomerase PptA (4-oxalocrotonate tautomerase family)
MPLVRISLRQGRTQAERSAIADGVHRALVETCNVPKDDRFQVVTEHAADLVYDAHYLGIDRTDGVIFVQIFLRKGRTVEQKKALYARIAANLEPAGVRRQDLFVTLSENDLADWSFGDGVAQYVKD